MLKVGDLKYVVAASLVVWWLRIFLAMEGTPVQSLVWEDPLEKEMVTCWGPAPAGSRGTLRMMA